jgi:hypothetical protein
VIIRVTGGPPAQPSDRQTAKATRELLADELTRVRAGALAWRNGLGALLAGLIGFGLIKGRSDVTQLSPPFAAAVGFLLLAALIAGATAAILIMRAAHGRPYAVSLRKVKNGSAADLVETARHIETDVSVRALHWGVVLSFACMALLTGAVGLTWYGPEKNQPRIEVHMSNGTRQCGEVVSLSAGRLTLKTSQGQVTVDLAEADGMAPVDSCTP